MIVYITLQFIMGQYVESMSEDLYQETQIVNASACEFMELILRSISAYADLCTEIMHLILEKLIETLRVAIDNRNDAQQVILLNLLKVILFENERLFLTRKDRSYIEKARQLFLPESFFKCFTDGLRS